MKVEFRYGKVNGKFKWIKKPDQIAKDIINSDARLFMANEAKRLMDPYVPADELMLARNINLYADEEHGVVEYISPYAHYQYMGELYVSSKTGSPFASEGEYKVPTGKKLNYQTFRHSLATDHWDQAMMVARKGDLTRAMQNHLKRGKK